MKPPVCFVLLLALLKKLLLSDNLSQDNQEKLYKWLSWAMQHADRLDPLHIVYLLRRAKIAEPLPYLIINKKTQPKKPGCYEQ
jgi:hypothetical protein